MGAFQSGFALGGNIFQQALDNADRSERRKREQERWDLERAAMQDAATERQRLLDVGRQTDLQLEQLYSPNAGNYKFSAPPQGLKLPVSAPPGPGEAPPPMDAGFEFPVPAAGGISQVAPAAGFKAPGAAAEPAGGYTFKAPPGRAETEAILGRIAALNRDAAGMRTSMTNRRAYEEEDFFAGKLKEYTGSPDQVANTRVYLNNFSQRLTMMKPDKNGFVQVSIVKPDGEADLIKLSKAEQAKLYAAGHLMELNPTKALDIISGVNKELGAAIAAENGLTATTATTNNQRAYQSGMLGVGQEKNAIDRIEAENRAKLMRAQAAKLGRPDATSLREFVDAKGNSVLLDITALPKGKDGTLAIPPGLKPKATRITPSPADIVKAAEGMAGMPDPSNPKKELDYQGRLRLARQALSGEAEPSASDLLLKQLTGGPAATAAKPASALPAPAQRAAPRNTAYSSFGMLTPWADIEAAYDAGDPAAIQYVSEYLRERQFGGGMPDSLRFKLANPTP